MIKNDEKTVPQKNEEKDNGVKNIILRSIPTGKPYLIPFRIGGPVKDPGDFGGRQQFLHKLSHYMLNFQNVSLRGERRTGKTSLLLYLAHKNSLQAIGLPEKHIAVYFNFHEVSKANEMMVWKAMSAAVAEQIKQKLENGQAEAEKFLQATKKHFAAGFFTIGFAEALNGLADYKIHLLYDEFERTANNPDLTDSFYDALRSLPVRAENISYVIATRTGLSALQPDYNKFSSPFFSIFTSLTLTAFREDEVQKLISAYFARAGMGHSLAKKLCAELPFLYDLTGYHPFFLQTYCYHLCANLDVPGWPSSVLARQKALQAFKEDTSPHFKFYWEISSRKEQELIKKLALEGSVDWNNETKAVIEKLKSRCLAVQSTQSKESWQLFSSVFAEWVTHTQDVILDEYRKTLLISCDIIRLTGLPEEDRHLAIQKFLLRQLYVPLHIVADSGKSHEQPLSVERGGKPERDKPPQIPWSVGECLIVAPRWVILGDPGSGKTTLLRWIATACLLHLNQDADFNKLPGIGTLGTENRLPILVRCRELDQRVLNTCSLEDILRQTLHKAELSSSDAELLISKLRERMARGQAILLIDGLDEISEPTARAAFCDLIGWIAESYPDAPIIVTSRIVGYREIHYRLRREFEHGNIAELSRKDKDRFVRRWCEVTESAERWKAAGKDLIHDIHSAERIERLTGNPMLLTTFVLVKRKVGKLPGRRHELYREAVDVLLNWRSEIDLPIDRFEALPQLEYLAYEMCRRGEQRLRRDEILELLEEMRRNYPHIRSVHRHNAEEFLASLEKRTGIVVQAGNVRYNGQMMPVYEFRHLTFQEYLAGLALVEGRFPGHDRNRGIAERIAPLAGLAVTGPQSSDFEISENWREALRLCAACCNDDDVDKVLSAILQLLPGEDPIQTGRARAVLAALCLADEPNVKQETADKILEQFAAHIKCEDGRDYPHANDEQTVMELAGSEWAVALNVVLARKFMEAKPDIQLIFGRLSSRISTRQLFKQTNDVESWINAQAKYISEGSEAEAVKAALALTDRVRIGEFRIVPGLIAGLFKMLGRGNASAHAASWVLWSLREHWKPESSEFALLMDYLKDASLNPEALADLALIVWMKPLPEAAGPCVLLLKHSYKRTCKAAIAALGAIKTPDTVAPLNELCTDLNVDADVRRSAVEALEIIKDPHAVEPLLVVCSDSKTGIIVRQAAAKALGAIKDLRAVAPLISLCADSKTEPNVRQAVAKALGTIKDPSAVEPLIDVLADADADIDVRLCVASALGAIKDQRAIEPLRACLTDNDPALRKGCLGVLTNFLPDEIDKKLLSRDIDGMEPWLDPQALGSKKHINKAAFRLKSSTEEITRRFNALAEKLGLSSLIESHNVVEAAAKRQTSGS